MQNNGVAYDVSFRNTDLKLRALVFVVNNEPMKRRDEHTGKNKYYWPLLNRGQCEAMAAQKELEGQNGRRRNPCKARLNLPIVLILFGPKICTFFLHTLSMLHFCSGYTGHMQKLVHTSMPSRGSLAPQSCLHLNITATRSLPPGVFPAFPFHLLLTSVGCTLQQQVISLTSLVHLAWLASILLSRRLGMLACCLPCTLARWIGVHAELLCFSIQTRDTAVPHSL